MPIIIKTMPGILPIRFPLNTTLKAKPTTKKPMPAVLLFIINDYAKAQTKVQADYCSLFISCLI